jgi:hypothetical protein
MSELQGVGGDLLWCRTDLAVVAQLPGPVAIQGGIGALFIISVVT